jgi:uncharacterized cupin superfamily protein
MPKPIINIDELDYMDWGHGEQFAARFGLIGRKLGAKGLGYNLTVVPPGKKAFPFHNHRVNDEMFFIVEGNGQLRMGDQIYPLRAGDVVACPPGNRDTAHQIINNSDADLRYLAVSTTLSPEIAEYPDSGKIGVISEVDDGEQRGELPGMWRLMMKDEQTAVDYWDGED